MNKLNFVFPSGNGQSMEEIFGANIPFEQGKLDLGKGILLRFLVNPLWPYDIAKTKWLF